MKKQIFKKSKFMMIKILFVKERGEYLRKTGWFHHFGTNVLWQPYTIPSEPYLVSVGDNVKVTAGVRFITHDLTPLVFESAGYPVHKKCMYYMDKIVVGNNVMIGANSIIMPGVTIEDNVIVAAGSVVSSNIPTGVVVAGVPARIIGSFEELAKKRYKQCQNRPCHFSSQEEINNFFWGEEDL